MVLLEVHSYPYSLIFIDGYYKDPDYMKELPWENWKSDYLKYISNYLYKRRIKPLLSDQVKRKDVIKTEENFFRAVVYDMETQFCPWYKLEIQKRPVECYRTTTFTYRYYSNPSVKKVVQKKMPFIYEEMEFDRANNRDRYIQIIKLRKELAEKDINNYYGVNQICHRCISNWINNLGFKIKLPEDYKDYETFEKNWTKKLDSSLYVAKKADMLYIFTSTVRGNRLKQYR